MATAPTPPARTVAESHWLILRDVAWDTYCQLRDAEGNNSVRMTYLDGDLALMSPALRHDGDSQLLGQLVRAAMTVMGSELRAIGSTTLRLGAAPGPGLGAGKEADAAFYLGDNERRIRGLQTLDLGVAPPPDLAIEVENTHTLTATAMTTYARLGIPEVWRCRVGDRSISIHLLDGGAYREVDRSVALPKLTPSLILEALDRFDVGDLGELGWFEWAKAWVRTLPGPDPAE